MQLKSEPDGQRREDGRKRETRPACIVAAGRGVPQLPDAIAPPRVTAR
jgi:hypothetical protein